MLNKQPLEKKMNLTTPEIKIRWQWSHFFPPPPFRIPAGTPGISKNFLVHSQSYLSLKDLVHRDLAARNILVGHGKKLKIGDFGLTRELYHEIYEVNAQKKLPIKWMAPESVYEQIFTSKSDV